MPFQSNQSRDKKRRIPLVRRPLVHWKTRLLDRHPKLIVLLYHRVLDDPSENPFNTAVSTETFQTQLEYVIDQYPVVPLSDVELRNGVQVTLTFDDGYEDNFRTVLPILTKKRLSATFLLTTDYINTGMPLWDWEIALRLNSNKKISRVEVDGVIVSKMSNETRSSFARRVIEHLKGVDILDLARVLGTLRNQSNWEVDCRCMTWDEVDELRKAGFEIGSHGCSHRSLTRIPAEEAIDEVANSKRIIEEHTGSKCRFLAFPFGGRGDISDLLVSAAHQTGFERCLNNTRGYNRIPLPSKACFNRVMVTEESDFRYLLG